MIWVCPECGVHNNPTDKLLSENEAACWNCEAVSGYFEPPNPREERECGN